MIKVQLEFFSVPEAIIALNAIMNLPEVKATPVTAAIAEVKAARRGRADKGHKRGEYKPRETNAAPQEPSGESPGPVGNDGHKQNSSRGEPVRDVPAVAAPTSPAEVVKAEIQKQQAEHAPVHATIGEKDAEAQAAVEKLFNAKGVDASRVLLAKFGVSRTREIPTARRAEFLEEAAKAAA